VSPRDSKTNGNWEHILAAVLATNGRTTPWREREEAVWVWCGRFVVACDRENDDESPLRNPIFLQAKRCLIFWKCDFT
jgi:hypothetical protein